MENYRFPLKCATCEVRYRCLMGVAGDGAWPKLFVVFGSRKKQTIFTQGLPVIGWYILCSGVAKLFLSTGTRKKCGIRLQRPGASLTPYDCGTGVAGLMRTLHRYLTEDEADFMLLDELDRVEE